MALKKVVESIKSDSNAMEFLEVIRELVYGAEGFDSRYRIDDYELTITNLRIVVSDRLTNQIVFSFSRRFAGQTIAIAIKPRLVV